MTLRLPLLTLLATTLAFIAGPALARCAQNLVELDRPGIRLASLGASLDGFPVASGNSPSRAIITFLGHSSYRSTRRRACAPSPTTTVSTASAASPTS